MNYRYRQSSRDPSSIYRTRGAFDPNSATSQAASGLPTAVDITNGMNSPIVAGDAFVATSPYTYSSLGGNTSVSVRPGDLLVFSGGTLNAVGNWGPVFKNLGMASISPDGSDGVWVPQGTPDPTGGMGVRVIGEAEPIFLD